MGTAESQFGKYELLDRIATGGMAEIYRARYRAAAGVTKPMVIKKILPHYATNKDFISMFINEAKIAVSLSHGNIAQVFDFGEINGEYFIAMEFVHGYPLSKVLRKAKAAGIASLPLPFAVFIAMELCRGLEYAHTKLDERGEPLHIIHRDVSPQNIILSYEGQVKIVDFGIARARHAGAGNSESNAVKGKFVYFAPEQARGRELDARTDIFAIGVVLYEMLCGKMPFEGKMMEVLGKIIRGDFQRPKMVNPDVPAALERVVLTAMAIEKEDRYPNAQAVHDALSGYLHSHAPTFSSAMLASLMGHLYQKELAAEGIADRVPVDFLDQLAVWRHPPPDDEAELSTRSDGPHALERAALEEQAGGRPALLRLPFRAPARWLLWALPSSAALLSFIAVLGIGYLGKAQVQLTSSPPGGLVLVDGRPASSVTPLLISGLSAGEAHVIEVRVPGMKPWSRKLVTVRGRTLPLHANLETDRVLPTSISAAKP